jgi:transcriptional regulator with XRE-family HTH domain
VTVHDRIRVAREEKGITLTALAKKIGKTYTCVWNWDHGNTSPRADTLPQLAEVLGVSVEWLRDGRDRGLVENKGSSGATLDSILVDAADRIGLLLGIDSGRVRLKLSFDDTHAPAKSPDWLDGVRSLVNRLPMKPRTSDELIAERRVEGSRGA